MDTNWDELIRRFDRLESLLQVIVDALTADQGDEDKPQLSLDGDRLPGERDQGMPL